MNKPSPAGSRESSQGTGEMTREDDGTGSGGNDGGSGTGGATRETGNGSGKP